MAFFTDLGRFPEAIILPSQPVGGVWLRDYLPRKWQRTWPSVLPRHVDRKSSRLLPRNRASLISVCEFVGGGGGGGGGLNCEAKVQVLVVTPSPLFFLDVGHKTGNSGAVWYVSETFIADRFYDRFMSIPYDFDTYMRRCCKKMLRQCCNDAATVSR